MRSLEPWVQRGTLRLLQPGRQRGPADRSHGHGIACSEHRLFPPRGSSPPFSAPRARETTARRPQSNRLGRSEHRATTSGCLVMAFRGATAVDGGARGVCYRRPPLPDIDNIRTAHSRGSRLVMPDAAGPVQSPVHRRPRRPASHTATRRKTRISWRCRGPSSPPPSTQWCRRGGYAK